MYFTCADLTPEKAYEVIKVKKDVGTETTYRKKN